MSKRAWPGLAAMLMMLAFVPAVWAGDRHECCCAQCGCEVATKICRLEKDEKKITITCWGIQDEDFCVGGPNSIACEHEECACEEPDPAGKACFSPKKYTWREWYFNECPQMFTKRKLMKRTFTKKVPTYKWVVEDLCEACKSETKTAQLDPAIAVPPPPKLPAGVEILQVSASDEEVE